MDTSSDSIRSSVYSPVPYFVYLICLVFLLFLSFQLSPSSEGHGTHRQLGLPPCGFLTVTGYPCPSCGLTTSFTHAARGEVLDSLKTQPFGTILFIAMILAGMLSVAGISRKIAVSYFLDSPLFEKLQVLLLLAFLLSWIYKIIVMQS